MVLPPLITPDKLSALVKPYMLKLRFTPNNVNAKVIHVPSSTVACFACTKEKSLSFNIVKSRLSGGDIDAAALIGKILGERLLYKDITAVSLDLVDRQHNVKVKTLLDSLRNAGVKLL